MPRRALVLVLALLQTLVLLVGTRTALALQAPAHTRPTTAAAPAEPVLHARPAVLHVVRPAAVRRAAPRKAVAVRPARPRPRPVHRVAPRRTRVVVSAVRVSPYDRMMAAVARIPGYRQGDATWVISSAYGHWGMADLGRGIVYVSPGVPANRMYDVVAHEWSHVLSVKPYDFDAMAAVKAMDSYFGGSGLVGAERAADCMARILGATWTHYTPCADAHWRTGARTLLSRQRL
jgi:hypothetical protein